jgi:predicted esterase
MCMLRGMIRNLFILLLIPILLSACNSPSVRNDKADTLATSGGFTKQIINTSRFQMLSYQRLSNENDPVTVYIEGDGYAFVGRHRVSLNPTPVDPISLNLALNDSVDNVIYIARPCQFIPMENNPDCSPEYWSMKRYAPEMISAVNEVIDVYKLKHKVKQLRLVGFSGGATVAAILAAQRNDVLDLRTVAGNLDIDMFSLVHNASPLTGSLNPTDFAKKLVHIPQLHLIGEDDEIILPSVTNSYVSALKQQDVELKCVHVHSIKEVSHTQGWEAHWKNYAPKKVDCNNL